MLDGEPAPCKERGTATPPPIFGPCLLWPNGWKVEGLEKHLCLGLARSRSRLLAKIRRLGLVSVSRNCRKVLVSDRKPNVSVSSQSCKLRSRLHPCLYSTSTATERASRRSESSHPARRVGVATALKLRAESPPASFLRSGGTTTILFYRLARLFLRVGIVLPDWEAV